MHIKFMIRHRVPLSRHGCSMSEIVCVFVCVCVCLCVWGGLVVCVGVGSACVCVWVSGPCVRSGCGGGGETVLRLGSGGREERGSSPHQELCVCVCVCESVSGYTFVCERVCLVIRLCVCV